MVAGISIVSLLRYGLGITGPGSSITGPGSRIRSPGFNIPYANGHLYVTTPTCLHCSPPPACLRCSPPPLTLAYVASYFTAHVANPDVVYDSTAVVLRPERHHHLLRGLKGREGGGRARTIIHQLQSLAGRQGVEGGGQGCKPSPGSGRQAGCGGEPSASGRKVVVPPKCGGRRTALPSPSMRGSQPPTWRVIVRFYEV